VTLELKPGDQVAICRRDNLVDMGTVDSVGVREVRLKDGSRWSKRSGHPIGIMVTFDSRWLRTVKLGDADMYRDLKRAEQFSYRMNYYVRWADVPLDKLERIAAILDENAELAKKGDP